MIFESGHDNITIGYEKYTRVITLNIQKIKHIGVSTGKQILGIPI